MQRRLAQRQAACLQHRLVDLPEERVAPDAASKVEQPDAATARATQEVALGILPATGAAGALVLCMRGATWRSGGGHGCVLGAGRRDAEAHRCARRM